MVQKLPSILHTLTLKAFLQIIMIVCKLAILNPCSGIKEVLWKDGGETLATADPVSGAFIPSNDSEWEIY